MATKKSAGSSRNGRDSKSKRLGVKKFNNSFVRAGNILIRQRGLKQKLTTNSFIGVGKDHTLYALQSGHLSLKTNLKILVKKKNNFWFKRKSNSTQIDKFMFIWCNQISKKKY